MSLIALLQFLKRAKSKSRADLLALASCCFFYFFGVFYGRITLEKAVLWKDCPGKVRKDKPGNSGRINPVFSHYGRINLRAMEELTFACG